MVRPINQNMLAVEKCLSHSQIPREGAYHTRAGWGWGGWVTWGSPGVSHETEGEEETIGKSLDCDFHGQNRRGKEAGL